MARIDVSTTGHHELERPSGAAAARGPALGRVAGLLVGEVLAAPFAAWLVRAMSARLLGTAASDMIVPTNIGTIMTGVGVSGAILLSVHMMLAAVWILALVAAVRSLRRDRVEAAALAEAGTVLGGQASTRR